MSVLPLWGGGAQSWGVRKLGSFSTNSCFLSFEGPFLMSSPPCSDQLWFPGQWVPSHRGTQEANSLQRNRSGGLCAGDLWGKWPLGRPRNMDGTPTLSATSTTWTSLCSLTSSGEGRFLNRLTYVFKEGSCLQHYFFEVEAHVSVCEQLQDLP